MAKLVPLDRPPAPDLDPIEAAQRRVTDLLTERDRLEDSRRDLDGKLHALHRVLATDDEYMTTEVPTGPFRGYSVMVRKPDAHPPDRTEESVGLAQMALPAAQRDRLTVELQARQLERALAEARRDLQRLKRDAQRPRLAAATRAFYQRLHEFIATDYARYLAELSAIDEAAGDSGLTSESRWFDLVPALLHHNAGH
jgi:hypothetical protein